MEDFGLYLIVLGSSLFFIMVLSITVYCKKLDHSFIKLKDIEMATDNIKENN